MEMETRRTSAHMRVDAELLERARVAYGQAIAVSDPVRIRFWDRRGLTMSQLRLLYLVSEAGQPPIGELACQMRVKPATLSGLAERLERQQLIERVHDPEDRRVVRVSLTAEGRRVLSEIQVAARAYLEPVLDRMGRRSVEAFVRALEEFRAAADEVGIMAEGLDD